ncbi:alpha/beta fold hydrolase [Plastoroseomonas hellenica]|uniref:alpha/beta fold hydrolase n=1 Tax=Plastoroseomonas hellenica TaxID=2687306 RepID=UPI0034621569
MWRAQRDGLGAGRQAIAYDPRGFGETCAEAAFRGRGSDGGDRRPGRGPAILVGCSGGGRVALDAALPHPSRIHALGSSRPGRRRARARLPVRDRGAAGRSAGARRPRRPWRHAVRPRLRRSQDLRRHQAAFRAARPPRRPGNVVAIAYEIWNTYRWLQKLGAAPRPTPWGALHWG